MSSPAALAAALTARGQKPLRWTVQPQLTAYPSLWKGLAYLFVYWDGQVYDLVAGRRLTPQGAFQSTPHGMGFAQTDPMQIDAPGIMEGGTGGLAVMCVADPPASGQYQVMVQRSGNNRNQIGLRAINGDLRFLLADPTGGNVVSPIAPNACNGDYHSFIGNRDDAGDVSIYVDGVASHSTNENFTFSIDPTNADFVLGGLPDTSTIKYTDGRLLDAGWNRSLTVAERELLGRDWFALLRPGPQMIAAQIASAGGTDAEISPDAQSVGVTTAAPTFATEGALSPGAQSIGNTAPKPAIGSDALLLPEGEGISVVVPDPVLGDPPPADDGATPGRKARRNRFRAWAGEIGRQRQAEAERRAAELAKETAAKAKKEARRAYQVLRQADDARALQRALSAVVEPFKPPTLADVLLPAARSIRFDQLVRDRDALVLLFEIEALYEAQRQDDEDAITALLLA